MVVPTVRLVRRGSAAAHLSRVRAGLIGPDRVKVGFPAGATSGEIMARAMWQEFGTSRGIPERPFVRNAFNANVGGYRAAMMRGGRAIMTGQMNKIVVLSQLGIKAAGDIQKGMPGTPPPNAPSTVRQKGSSTTLVDTGQMRQSVTWKLDG